MCSVDGPPLKKLRPQPLRLTDPLPIYLDYNATTPLCAEAWKAMSAVLSYSWGNPSSTHPYGLAAKFALEEARGKVAAAIGAATPSSIVFTSGGTESNNLAIVGGFTALRKRFPDRRYIITTNVEHPAVEEVLKCLETRRWEELEAEEGSTSDGQKLRSSPFAVVRRFPINPETGCVCVEEWRKLFLQLPGGPQSVALVTVMHANNEIGSVNPIEDLVKLVRNTCGEEALFHTDAAQSVGKVPVDVSAMHVDMLSICSHKFYGPKGVGALFVKEGVRVQNILFGANHENGVRPGTENVLLVTGMAEALHVACKNLAMNAAVMRQTRDELFLVIKEELAKVNMDCVLNGDIDRALPNTLSIALFKTANNGKRRYISAHGLIVHVGDEVCMSCGAACHSSDEQLDVSASLRGIGVDLDRAVGTLRLSTGRTTTIAEVRRAARVIVRRAAQQFGDS